MTMRAREALERLRAGNERFLSGQSRRDTTTSREIRALVAGQSPLATILSCADSRVPAEKVFDAGVGELFSLRVAGNVWTSELAGSAEYAVLVLGTPLLVVMGHTCCGAVRAALDARQHGTRHPERLQGLLEEIGRAIEGADGEDEAVVHNVARQVELARGLPVFAQAIREGRLEVVGAVYDLSTGRVDFVEGP